MLDAVIGLGGNQGDSVALFTAALQRLRPHLRDSVLSPLYRTVPVGGPEQPDFYNAALRGSFAGSARELLTLLLETERSLGRERRVRWGPRTLDLDLLWIAGLHVNEPGLQVPHPRLGERAFALMPLLAVAPDARDPSSGQAYSRLLAAVGEAGVQRVSEPPWEALRGSC